MSEQAEADRIVSVITCDTEGRIETFNKNAEKLFGYSAEEVINKKYTIVFSILEADEKRQEIKRQIPFAII